MASFEQFKEVPTHISEIRVGDLVNHQGEVRTVCKSNMHKCPSMGHLLFGDSYSIGTVLVKRLVYVKPT